MGSHTTEWSNSNDQKFISWMYESSPAMIIGELHRVIVKWVGCQLVKFQVDWTNRCRGNHCTTTQFAVCMLLHLFSSDWLISCVVCVCVTCMCTCNIGNNLGSDIGFMIFFISVTICWFIIFVKYSTVFVIFVNIFVLMKKYIFVLLESVTQVRTFLGFIFLCTGSRPKDCCT